MSTINITRTLDQLVTRAKANFRRALSLWPMGDTTFLGRSSLAFAKVVWGTQKAFEYLWANIVPSATMDDDLLSEWAATLGLPDGQGGYGRLKPTAASGGSATITGVKGTAYTDGTTATAEDGTTQIKIVGLTTIPGSAPGNGSVAAIFDAVTIGAVGNLPAGTICTWDSPPFGSDATFTLTGPLTGGEDTESNPACYARIVARLQNPPRGGVNEDYRNWATVAGIVDVYVYPKRDGVGTVDVVVTQGGSGAARAQVPSTIVAAAQANVNANMPSTVDHANVFAPWIQPTVSKRHAVLIKITPSLAKYNFDWDDTAGPYTVNAFSSGPPATIQLNTLAPQSLKDAIDAYIAGGSVLDQAPRLQVLAPASTVVNPPIRAVAYADGGGMTTLTLETTPSTWWAPSVGDAVYAYGPAVATIAAGAQALADALGPSRQSGLADAFTPWEDKLTISGLIAVAENAIDTDGTKLIEEVPVGGCTIDGSAADVEGTDNLFLTNPPELLLLKSIAIVQS